MVESEVPDHGNKGAGTGGDAVPIITTPAIMGATPLIPPVNTGAGVGAINPQNTGNLGISHPTVTPIVPPIRTDADRVQTPNNETGTPTGTGASTSNPPKEQSIGEVITAQI